MIRIFSKESINLTISIFVILIISLLCCISLYYITPNNYILYNYKIVNNIKPSKKINIKIDKYGEYIIKNYLNNFIIDIKIKIKNYPIKILISNFLKSQNLYILDNTLIQAINNSYITIINNNDKSINLTLNFYKIKEV